MSENTHINIRKKKMKFKVLLAVAAVSASSLASAQWYGGASIGSSNASVDTSGMIVTGATASSVSKNESDTGYKLLAGYQFHPNFALEGGYVNLGKLSATLNVTAPAVGSLNVDYKADGWNLMAVGILPVSNDFSLFGKIGGFYSTTKGDASTTGAVVLLPGQQTSLSKSEFNLAYGLGVQYNINKSISVRGELERFADLRPSDAANKANVDLYSIGLIYKF